MEEGTEVQRNQVVSVSSPRSGSPGRTVEAASPPLVPLEGDGSRGQRHRHRHRQGPESLAYDLLGAPFEAASAPWLRDETWTCLVLLLTFWFFVSMILIVGFYGSVGIALGPNSSRLLYVNSLFVQDIKLQSETETPGQFLYGFSECPPLDVRSLWSEEYNVSIPANSYKEWIYYLNEGSQIDITYNIKSQRFSPLSLVIIQGEENFYSWIEDPLLSMTTLSWNLVNGTGHLQQKIRTSSDYYIALRNLDLLSAEVEVNLEFDALIYNTTGAYYKCSLRHNLCVMKLTLLRANAAVLATYGNQKNGVENRNMLYANLSYGPRWVTYFVGSGLLSAVILLAFKIINHWHTTSVNLMNSQVSEGTAERMPLLANKDDDCSSLGSSYDSISNDEANVEELQISVTESKLETGNEAYEMQHLCTICCAAPKDSFFLPCGHCATCFTCGSRVIEEAGICPICRRRMKKVKKIFTI